MKRLSLIFVLILTGLAPTAELALESVNEDRSYQTYSIQKKGSQSTYKKIARFDAGDALETKSDQTQNIALFFQTKTNSTLLKAFQPFHVAPTLLHKRLRFRQFSLRAPPIA